MRFVSTGALERLWCVRSAAGSTRTGWQVFVDRLVTELGQKIETAAVRDKTGDIALGIAKVAEMAGAGRACPHAGGDPILRLQIFVVNPINAQGAFLNHTVVIVIFARAIRARPGTEFAADAGIRIDQDNAVFFALVGGTGRANRNTIGFVAMEA